MRSIQVKKCGRCKNILPLTKFRPCKTSKSGYQSYCIECNAEAKLESRYGMSLEEYNQMVSDQDGGCKICGTKESKLYVDHDHDTGKVRGLLCHCCNAGIGLLKDSPDIMQKAIQYVRANQEVKETPRKKNWLSLFEVPQESGIVSSNTKESLIGMKSGATESGFQHPSSFE